MSEQFKVPKGLYGVSITDSTIARSGVDGSLIYRGYAIGDIASHAGFEETAYLVLKGHLPKKNELQAFSEMLYDKMEVEARLYRLMKDLGKNAHPIDAIRTAISALASIDTEHTVPEQQSSIEAKMSVLAANSHRVPRGLEPVSERTSWTASH